ncbi:MAG: hypothetical protein EAY65_00795 [Alphaproteobacteria bacterium]|nr:MAG: hypothetical protein EAY65_00795 [Alphaproteobacteria bacterium]
MLYVLLVFFCSSRHRIYINLHYTSFYAINKTENLSCLIILYSYIEKSSSDLVLYLQSKKS